MKHAKVSYIIELDRQEKHLFTNMCYTSYITFVKEITSLQNYLLKGIHVTLELYFATLFHVDLRTN